MKDRATELKTSARRGTRTDQADVEAEVLAKIAEMREPDRVLAARLHAIIKASVPDLSPRTWYGMPAYARDGSIVCHFQTAQKFNTRYATLGFSDKANLDEGDMWPVAYALKELTLTSRRGSSRWSRRRWAESSSPALPDRARPIGHRPRA